MSLTITIPGAVDVTTGSTAPAVLTIGVGVPGATGPAGPGVPAGGTSGQYLQKTTTGVDYATDWVTLNLSAYLTTSAAASTYYPLTNPSGYITSSSLSPYLLSSTAASTYQPISGMSSYLTTSAAASTYAVTARGLPAAGTTGQVLTKQSGADYDVAFTTLIPGDRYLTSSTTSLTINNANKTLTVGTGLSYTTQQDVVIAHDAANHMHAVVLSYNSGTGVMEVDVRSHTGSGTFSTWTVNVGGTVPLASIVWGDITGVLGNQTDLSTALNAKLDSSTAASTYAPIASPTFSGVVTIPSGASIDGFAPLASPALTGSVTINSNSTGAALFIEQSGTGNILTLHDQASDTNFVAIDQNGKVNTVAADATIGAGFNLPHGTAPTTPVNGDVWSTTSGLFARINGSTRQYVDVDGTQTINGNKTFSNATLVFGNSTATSTTSLASGATLSGSTKTVNVGTGGVSGSTTNVNIGSTAGTNNITINGPTTFNASIAASGNQISIGTGTAASNFNFGTGVTASGLTKAVAIGTLGAAGSTTTVTIGNTTGSTTTLQGTTNGVTAAADTNSVALATTAFVVGQAGSATPLVDGTAAVGTSLRYARQDHVHPTDTSRAALASPTFTGTPAAPTAAVDTNTTQLATTAFVVAQAAAATPLANGTAAVGTSLRYARADHVHPTDTTRAPLASPALTGTPTAPTATGGTNTTQIATTAFVQAAVPAIASVAQTNSPSSNTVAMSPDKVRQMMMFPGMQEFLGGGTVGTSGAGAAAPSNSARWRQFVGPNASTAGYSAFVFDTFASQLGFLGSKRGVNEFGKNYARPFWASGRTIIGLDSGTFTGDVNNTFRCELGGRNVLGQSGDPTGPSLGWRVAGGGASAIVFYMRSRSSINGGTYSQTTTSFTPTANQWFDWMVTYNGTDTCQMYVNDTLVGTISANFTGFQGEMFNFYTEQIEQTGSAAVRMGVSQLPPRIFFSE